MCSAGCVSHVQRGVCVACAAWGVCHARNEPGFESPVQAKLEDLHQEHQGRGSMHQQLAMLRRQMEVC